MRGERDGNQYSGTGAPSRNATNAARPNTRSSIIGNQAILYRVGSTVRCEDPDGICLSLRSTGTLASRRYGSSRLCSGEVVEVRDPCGGASSGSWVLGEFTPCREK